MDSLIMNNKNNKWFFMTIIIDVKKKIMYILIQPTDQCLDKEKWIKINYLLFIRLFLLKNYHSYKFTVKKLAF